MNSPSKKRTAQLLLCSLLLESCYNPNLGTSKKTRPAPAAPTYQQELQDTPPSLTLTPPDDHPIPFPDHPSQPQAALKSQAQPPATTQPLPRPSSEAPSTRPASWRKPHALLRSQKPAQAQQKEQIARAQPANEPPTTQPRQAAPATPTPSSSLTHQTPPDIAHQAFPAQGGQQVRFIHQAGQWQAQVTERIGAFSRTAVLPVVCERHGDIEAALRALQGKPEQYVQRRIQVLTPQQVPYVSKLVYLGELGLPGGMDGEPAGSGEPQDELPPRRHTSALGSTLRPALPSALEPTKSQGPTPLEQDQQEAAQLREEIPKLYAKLPQATEEADAQVVEELTTRLARLSKLEPFCAPAPGSDGAKEHIEKLRQTHHTHWGPTAYGAKARQQLTALLEQAYAEELDRVVHKKSVNEPPNRVARLAKVLGQLAVLHQEQGEETGDLAYYTDAATLYQNVLSVCEKELKEVEPQSEEAPAYQAQIAAAYSSLAQLRQALVAKAKGGEEGAAAPGSMSAADLREEIAKDQQALQALRDDAQERVAELEALLNKPGSPAEEIAAEQAYIEGSRALFGEIAQEVRDFLAKLYQESEQELGPAPCQYTVMGLGSMALAQMTPYSDLEFAILMEDAPDAATAEEWRQYLRHLTHLVHFRVINLGETVIPRSKYEIDLDPLSKRGLNFDLGGKTPLGRRDKPHLKKPYELIQPVAGMMDYLKNERDKMAHMDKLLPFILESTCYVHGNEELHAAYVAAKHAFLTEGPVCKARALKKLLEGVVEMDYSPPGKGIPKPQRGDLEDFAPQFDLDDAGRLYDVKQEIYRLPDRLLYRLAMYYGLLPESGWDAVAQLATQGIIGQGASAQDAAHHLQYIVSFATMLRLRTYLHHGKQEEGVTMLRGASQEPAQQAVREFFTLPPAALQAGGSLFKYYYTALPLHRKMEEFFKALGLRPQALAWLQSTPEPDPALARELETLFGKEGKFSPSKEARFSQAAAFYDDSDNTRGEIHQRLLQYEAAKTCYERALKRSQALYKGNHPAIANALNNVGLAYDRLGQVEEGLKYFEQALKMRKAFYEGNHPEVAQSLNNVGSAYQELGQAHKALEYKKQALEMYQAFHKGNHPAIAGSLNNVGIAYEALGQAHKALEYKKQALEMRKALYKGNHPAIADALNNVSSTYQKLGQVEAGLKYQEEALEMRKALYKGNHPAIADALNNVGSAYQELGQAHKALEYYKPALEMRKALYKGNHPAIAGSLNNMGIAYEALGQAQKALEYKKQALGMYQAFYKGNHHEVAGSLNSVGSTYYALGQVQEALEYFEPALEMRKALYKGNHHEVAQLFHNVGLAYGASGQAQKALEYFGQALEMYQALYKGNHHEVAQSLNNVGSAYQELGQAQKALEYFGQALEMYQALYKGNHHEVAQLLHNVGLAHQNLGEYQQAKQYLEQALAISKNSYGIEHPTTKTIANKLAATKVSYFLETALAAHKQHDVAGAISHYKAALLALPAEQKEMKSNIGQNLGCVYHLAAIAARQEGKEESAQSYLAQATATFEEAVAASEKVKVDLYAEYANFLIAIGQLKQAYPYLLQAIASGDDESELSYGLMEQATVSPILQARISQQQEVEIRGIDYAYYLLIHHYETFKQAGIQLDTTQAAYLAAYQQAIGQRTSEEGKEQQDELAYYLLGSLYQELGNEPAVAQAFALAQEVLKQENKPQQAWEGQHQAAQFIQACVAGNEDVATSLPISSLEKDLHDAQGNALIAWMAQHEMMATLDQVLNLGWNPNLPNTSQVYPLHYGAMKNPDLTQCLLQAGAHPFVQTPKGNTPAQVARNQGKVATLAVLLPPLAGISFEDMAAFEASYQAYKQHLATHQPAAEELLAALALALQLGDAALVQAIAAQQAPQPLLAQLIEQYPWAAEALHARWASLLPEPVAEHPQPALEKAA